MDKHIVSFSGGKDWRELENGLWENKTSYFCKTRNKIRIKWIKYVEVKCSICGKKCLQKKGNEKKYKRSYCSDECRAKAIKKYYSGEKHMSYKEGRYKDKKGYIHIKKLGHHRADAQGYVYEHVLIAENVTGEEINIDRDIHHINGIRCDNRPENLMVLSRAEHVTLHKKEQKEGGAKCLNI